MIKGNLAGRPKCQLPPELQPDWCPRLAVVPLGWETAATAMRTALVIDARDGLPVLTAPAGPVWPGCASQRRGQPLQSILFTGWLAVAGARLSVSKYGRQHGPRIHRRFT